MAINRIQPSGSDSNIPAETHSASARYGERAVVAVTRMVDRVGRIISPSDDDALGESRIGVGHGAIKFGLWSMVFVFGGFGLWAALAPIDSAAVAPGVVVLDADKKVIQHLEGGIVEEILVREGDHVEAGQALVRLSQTAAEARADLIRSQYYAEKAAEARLIAERDAQDTIAFPAELDVKGLHVKEIEEAIKAQNGLFSSRKKALEGEVSILNQRMAQFKEEIIGLEAQQQAVTRQRELIGEEEATVAKLVAQGNAAKPRLLALQRSKADLGGQQGEYAASIARANQGISEAQIAIVNKRNEFQNNVVKELREVQVNVTTLGEQLKASQDILNRIVIAAPQSGIVTGLKVHTKGGVITPGQEVMSIIPQDDKLIVEAKVSVRDIDIVYAGLKAKIRLTAYRVRHVPPLEGTVQTISADRFVDQARGEAYYLARVEVDDEQTEKLKNVKLYPGMPADVLIVTGERTMLSYLLNPITEEVYKAFREE